MAILSGPQNRGIPGYQVIKPPKPQVVVGPQNRGLPGYRPGDPGNPTGQLQGVQPVAAPAAPVAPAAPPPPDYMSLALTDPQYTQGVADIDRHNTDSLADMLKGYLGNSQASQDSANAHGTLFSGAAVNAQNQAADAYKTAQERQAAEVLSGKKNLQFNVFNRLISQLAGGQ